MRERERERERQAELWREREKGDDNVFLLLSVVFSFFL